MTIFGFAWIELAWVNGQDPSALAIAALIYSVLTLVAMAVFGTEAWLRHGEGFSVYYNLFSRISAVEVRDGRLGLRRPLSALCRLDPVPGTVALLVGGARHGRVRRRERGTAVEQDRAGHPGLLRLARLRPGHRAASWPSRSGC